MTVYDSIERGADDECEPLRGRRPRTFTLTQLLVACGAVCVCAVGATTVVNNSAQLGGWHDFVHKVVPQAHLQACNAQIKSKIKQFQSISAELGDTPARQGRVLLGGKSKERKERDALYSCRCLSNQENADLLAECKTELAIHNECLILKRNANSP